MAAKPKFLACDKNDKLRFVVRGHLEPGRVRRADVVRRARPGARQHDVACLARRERRLAGEPGTTLHRPGRRQGRPLRLGCAPWSRCSGRRPSCGSRAARSPSSFRARSRRLRRGGPALRARDRSSIAVDEADDRARRLEPEHRDRRLARSLRCRRRRAGPRARRSSGTSAVRWATRSGSTSIPARSERTTFSRNSDRMSRTCWTGARSQAPSSSRPVRGHGIDDAVRAPAAALEPGGADQAGPLEPVEAVVDDRPADRPDRPDLTAARQLGRERPAVRGVLVDEREDGPVVRTQALRHRATAYSRSEEVVDAQLDSAAATPPGTGTARTRRGRSPRRSAPGRSGTRRLRGAPARGRSQLR